MKIDRAIVVRHWEQAALEQLSSELQKEGYSIQREVPFGNTRADLVASKPDGSFTVFEVRVPGQNTDQENTDPGGWARQAAALRDQARALGGRFQLVIVRPPRETEVEIDGLEAGLRDALIENMPAELEGLSSDTVIDDVSGTNVLSIVMRAGTVQIAGEASVTVTLYTDDEAVAHESFPFSFHARLDSLNRITALEEVEVDLSSWYGDDEPGEQSDPPDAGDPPAPGGRDF